MAKLDKHKLGLVLGCFLALVHAVWAILVGITPTGMQRFIEWILGLHMISMPMTIMPFKIMSAVLLVVVTFIFGYVFGYVLAALANWQYKK